MSGLPDGTFRPYDALSRQQMVVVTIRCLGWEDEALQLTANQVAQVLDRSLMRAPSRGPHGRIWPWP